eukprot:363331-Chlamydomonas_euryale.AAC.2
MVALKQMAAEGLPLPRQTWILDSQVRQGASIVQPRSEWRAESWCCLGRRGSWTRRGERGSRFGRARCVRRHQLAFWLNGKGASVAACREATREVCSSGGSRNDGGCTSVWSNGFFEKPLEKNQQTKQTLKKQATEDN